MRRPGKWALVLLASAAALVALELVARLGLPFGWLGPHFGMDAEQYARGRAFLLGEETSTVVPDGYVGYRLNPALPRVNRWGFYGEDWEPGPRDGLRIACVGGSTTQGVGGNSYPSELQKLLDASGAGEVEVLNFGVAGWTSAESLVNYALLAQDFEPDVVLVHHAVNDLLPRRIPDFRSDYRHFRKPWSQPELGPELRFLVESSEAVASVLARRQMGALIENFVARQAPTGWRPDPDAPFTGSSETFLRNLRALCVLVRSHGGVPVLLTMPAGPEGEPWRLQGIREHNADVREFAASEQVLLVDLEATFERHSENLEPEFLDFVHLTRKGERAKANAVLTALRRAGLVEP